MEGKIIRITKDDPNYPWLLKEIQDAPQELYVRGKLPEQNKITIAIVGTRKPTTYGAQITKRIGEFLARAGVVIVSGMAFGIDAIAHKAAVECGAPTVAVLADGVDDESIYPKHNIKLAHEIIKTGGAVISELPPGTPVEGRYSFLYRNRIIAGMSLATVVTEGAFDSGSLITARAALEYNRQVFACPHQMFTHLGEGPNQLIKMGAEPVLKLTDIFEVLNLNLSTQQTLHSLLPELSKTEQMILRFCNTEGKTVDELSSLLKLPAFEINIAITNLELKGIVKQDNGIIHIIHHSH